MSNLSLQPQNNLPSPAPSPMSTLQPISEGPMDPDQLRQTLETELFKLGQNLYELEICAGDVAQNREEAVPDYLWKINQSFLLLSNLSSQVTDSVPRQVVENVDQFKNPHSYTKNALSRATGENQYALGRVLGLESFRRQLHNALSESFPTIPLPDRRHQPATSVQEGVHGEDDSNGDAQRDGVDTNRPPVNGGEIKREDE